jgi:hypothetical protein
VDVSRCSRDEREERRGALPCGPRGVAASFALAPGMLAAQAAPLGGRLSLAAGDPRDDVTLLALAGSANPLPVAGVPR